MILTPVTLWKDFDDSLPLDEEVVSMEKFEDASHYKIFYYGRQTEKGRVKIFSHYFTPANKGQYPAVLLLFEAGFPADMTFVRWFVEQGYAVLAVDYCGDDGTPDHTYYPEDVDYANFVRAGRAMEYVDTTAKQTSWYEWAAVARYAVKYLRTRPEVTKVGAIGVRTGGEILWKIAPFAALDCMIPICAAGWKAYLGKEKFGDSNATFDEERHRFIAGIDSQSYAPYCKCPVLLLCAINDKKYNSDRVYDTFQQINPETPKAILFSPRANGLLGGHTHDDMNLFLDKYLKERSVFVSRPIEISVGEDDDGNLIATGTFDGDGVIEECGVFYSEKITDNTRREWIRVLEAPKEEKLTYTFPLNVYEGAEKVLVYSFVRYTNGFSVTSKIYEAAIKKKYKNTVYRSRVIYDSDDGTNGFLTMGAARDAVADCFVSRAHEGVSMQAGYGGIEGIGSERGIVTYRVGEARYQAPEGASLHFNAYAQETENCKVIIRCASEDGAEVDYSVTFTVEGRGKWKEIVLSASDFKAESGEELTGFAEAEALALSGNGVIFNNILWL